MPSQEKRPPGIIVFAGSTRTDSIHRKLARVAVNALRDTGAKAKFVELKDYPMPLYDGDLEANEGAPATVREFAKLVKECDGFVIASPEYNGSFSPLVKNVVDWITRPEPGERHTSVFQGKVAGLISASPGPGGGRRGLRHLRELLEMIGVTVIDKQIVLPRALQALNTQGELVRDAEKDEFNQWAKDLVTVTIHNMRVAA